MIGGVQLVFLQVGLVFKNKIVGSQTLLSLTVFFSSVKKLGNKLTVLRPRGFFMLNDFCKVAMSKDP